MESTDGRLDSAERQLESADGRLDSAEPQLESADGRFDSTERRLQSEEGQLESAKSAESRLVDLAGRLELAGTAGLSICVAEDATCDVPVCVLLEGWLELVRGLLESAEGWHLFESKSDKSETETFIPTKLDEL